MEIITVNAGFMRGVKREDPRYEKFLVQAKRHVLQQRVDERLKEVCLGREILERIACFRVQCAPESRTGNKFLCHCIPTAIVLNRICRQL